MEVLYTTQITYIHASIIFLVIFAFVFVIAFIFSLIEYYSFDVVQLILGILAAASIAGIIIVGCNNAKVTVTTFNANTINNTRRKYFKNNFRRILSKNKELYKRNR